MTRSLLRTTFALAPLAFALAPVACGGSVTDAPAAPEAPAADAGVDVAPVDDAAPEAAPPDAKPDVEVVPYPGPHPSMPEMPSHGGPVLSAPDLVTVTFPGDPLTQFANDFDDFLVDTSWWKDTGAEYGVGKGTSTKHVVMPEAAASDITDLDLQAWLKKQVTDGALPVPDEQTLYVLFFPAGTSISLAGQGTSCRSFGGYHSSTYVDVGGGKQVNAAYAVIPRCGNRGSDLTVTISHEVNEAVTDPHPLSVRAGYAITEQGPWNLAGGESADLCEFVSPVTEGGYDLARGWSNKNAAIGQQPCVPVPPDPTGTPYFNAGITNEDATAKAGDSLEIDLQCYSFGPLPGPMTVDAQPFSAQYLSFKFEPPTCVNGDTIKMTIQVSPNASSGTTYHYSLLTSVSADLAHLWRGQVTVE